MTMKTNPIMSKICQSGEILPNLATLLASKETLVTFPLNHTVILRYGAHLGMFYSIGQLQSWLAKQRGH